MYQNVAFIIHFLRTKVPLDLYYELDRSGWIVSYIFSHVTKIISMIIS